MSDYTITIHELQKNGFDFGLNDYEIFDEEYRPILNDAILKYYEFREIGFMNPAMFRDRLRARMDLIMRNKYNMLYKIKQTEFNPLYNIEIYDTYTRTINTETEDNGTSTIDSKSKANNTNNTNGFSSRYPSDAVTENDLTSTIYADVGNVAKATEETTTQDNTTNETTNNGKGQTVETFEHTQEGSSAGLPFSKALLQFKQFVDGYQLDQQVINELSDLFISVW